MTAKNQALVLTQAAELDILQYNFKSPFFSEGFFCIYVYYYKKLLNN